MGADAVDLSPEALQEASTDALSQRGRVAGPVTPLAVVRPDRADAVARVLALASEAGVSVVAYGAGTGLMGGARTLSATTIVLDTSRLNAIEVRAEDRLVWAGAGAVLADIDAALRAQGLCLGHDPWTFPVASAGGPISTNGLGYKGGRYGGIADQMVALEVVLADGTLFRTPAVPRRSAGPDYMRLFAGAEGTLGVITAAALRAFAVPDREAFLGFRFETFEQGFEVIREIARLGLRPSLLDYGEEHASPWPDRAPRGEEPPCLYLGFEGFLEEVEASVARATTIARSHQAKAVSEPEVHRFWDDRHVIPERFGRPRRRENPSRRRGFDYVHVALPASRVIEFRARCHADTRAAGVGLLECGLWTAPELFSAVLVGPPEDVGGERVAEVVDTLLMAAQDLGGSMEYVHGVGLRYAHLMAREHGAGMTVLQRIKSALDPAGILNPGKLGL